MRRFNKVFCVLILIIVTASICAWIFIPRLFKKELKFDVESDVTTYSKTNVVIIKNLNEFDVHEAKLSVDSYWKYLSKNIGDIKINETLIIPINEGDWIYKVDKPSLDPSSPDYPLMSRTAVKIEAVEGVFEVAFD